VTHARLSTGARVSVGLLAGVPVLLLILATLGALSQTTVEGLPVVPWQTLWSLPLDRWVRDVAASIVLGFVVVGGLLLPRLDHRLIRLASLAALAWLVALLAQVPLTVSELLGRPLSDSFDPQIVMALLTQTQLGQILIAQIVLVSLVALLAWAILGRVTAAIVLGLAATAAGLTGLMGHSGLHSGHTSASISLAIHLLAVGIWVGGLIAVCSHVMRYPDDAATAIRRFSTLALVCVIVLAESGLLNASLRVDGVASLITTPYGTLILAKATLLAALIVFGWHQRRYVVPTGDRSTLVRFASYEVLLMGIALGISVALSRTAPPAGAIAGDRITAGALALLGLAVPLVLVWAGAARQGRRDRPAAPGPAWLVRLTAGYPEPFAVGLAVVTYVVAAVVPSGLLGIGVAAVLASLVLVAVGWAFALAVLGPRGTPALILAAVLWPAALWLASRSDPVETGAQIALAGAVGLACLALLALVRGRTRAAANAEPVREEVPVS
jgi:putative copper export protein